MTDYISREAALEQCKRHGDYTAWSIEDGIEVIPAADVEPVRRWIPCSERSPGKKGCYLVAAKHWHDGKPVTREAFWNGADWLSCEIRVEITHRVTHWMPMPEPPKEGGTENAAD